MKEDSQKEMRKEMFDNDDSFHGSAVLATFTGGNRDDCRHFQRKLALARLQVMILVRHIKARTDLLRVQVPMSHNQGVGISPAKPFQQVAQGNALGIRSGVSRLSVLRQSADVTDSNRMPVMVLAMCPDFIFIPSLFDGSIGGNHIVVPTALPTKGTVIAVNVSEAEGTARPIGGTVHDYQRDGSHRLLPSAPPAAPVISNSTSFTM